MKLFTAKNALLFFFVTQCLVGLTSVRAEEDEVDEEDDGTIEEEGGEVPEPEVEESTTTSQDADTTILFTKPTGTTNMELPAGQIIEFLVGFTNKGSDDMVMTHLEASLRYPMDFTYHIQNFSAVVYEKTVKPKQQATVVYSFVPADAFAGRPIGLVINLNYKDSMGNTFIDPVFNETVQIVEFDEGFDTETFFIYVTMGGVIVLALFLAFNFLSGGNKKRSSARKAPVETGTGKGDDVDYEWIPKSALLSTPGSTSPRQRKGKKAASVGSESD